MPINLTCECRPQHLKSETTGVQTRQIIASKTGACPYPWAWVFRFLLLLVLSIPVLPVRMVFKRKNMLGPLGTTGWHPDEAMFWVDEDHSYKCGFTKCSSMTLFTFTIISYVCCMNIHSISFYTYSSATAMK